MVRWVVITVPWVLLAWLSACDSPTGGGLHAACNVDLDCRGALFCIEGSCELFVSGDCLPDGCADDEVCVDGVCVGTGCLSMECLENEVCVGGVCYPEDCPTRSCPGIGEICVEEDCLPSSCLEVDCPDDQRCAAGRCYPVDCETKRCPGYGEVCIEEECVQRSCVEVECPADQHCANGYCYPVGLCGGVEECWEGYVCEDNRCVEPSCVMVECPAGTLCADGLCWPQDCLQEECAEGEVCEDATCVARPCVAGRCEPCESAADCDPQQVCVGGVCAPCTRDEQCPQFQTCGGGGQVGVCGCTPESDAEFCERFHVLCGPAAGDDTCAVFREVADCGQCADGEACVAGACLVYTYSWKTGNWSACSVPCGGGTQSRSVWCERSDGVTVDDALCGGGKPATSRSCNTHSCCSTGALQQYRDCGGNDVWMAVHYGSDTGSAADRSACASQCTIVAPGLGMSSWCCSLYEDSSAGTNWVCKIYEGGISNGDADEFAATGQCQ